MSEHKERNEKHKERNEKQIRAHAPEQNEHSPQAMATIDKIIFKLNIKFAGQTERKLVREIGATIIDEEFWKLRATIEAAMYQLEKALKIISTKGGE